MANDQMQQMSFDEWLQLDRDRRAEVYAGLFLAMELAANVGEPNPLSDEEMSLLGYGLFRDREAAENGVLRFDNPAGEFSQHIPMTDFFNYENVIKLMDATNDPRLELEKTSTTEATVGKWDSIEEEGLYVPILVTALTGGAGALAATGAAGSYLVGTTAMSIRWLPTTIFNVIRTTAGTTAGRAVIGVAGGVSATSLGLGTAGLIASIGDQAFNYDVNYAAQMDAQAMQMASMATPVDVFERQQVMAAGFAPPDAEQLAKQDINWDPSPAEKQQAEVRGRITQASLYAESAPVPGAPGEMAFEDNPWFGGMSENYDPTLGRGDYWYQEEEGAPSDDTRRRRFIRYRESDYELAISQMSPGTLVWFQNLAQSALLINLGESDYGTRANAGIFDDATKQALAQVMVQANTDGTTWYEAARRMAESGQAWAKAYEDANAPAPRTYTKPAFMPKDWAEIANSVKATIQQRLGRPANDWEVELLADEMRTYERQEYDAYAEAHRAAWEAEGRAIDTGADTVTGEFEQVNAEARLAEFFEEKFANEIDRVDRVTSVSNKTASLMQGFDNAASIVGGR